MNIVLYIVGACCFVMFFLGMLAAVFRARQGNYQRADANEFMAIGYLLIAVMCFK